MLEWGQDLRCIAWNQLFRRAQMFLAWGVWKDPTLWRLTGSAGTGTLGGTCRGISATPTKAALGEELGHSTTLLAEGGTVPFACLASLFIYSFLLPVGSKSLPSPTYESRVPWKLNSLTCSRFSFDVSLNRHFWLKHSFNFESWQDNHNLLCKEVLRRSLCCSSWITFVETERRHAVLRRAQSMLPPSTGARDAKTATGPYPRCEGTSRGVGDQKLCPVGSSEVETPSPNLQELSAGGVWWAIVSFELEGTFRVN